MYIIYTYVYLNLYLRVYRFKYSHTLLLRKFLRRWQTNWQAYFMIRWPHSRTEFVFNLKNGRPVCLFVLSGKVMVMSCYFRFLRDDCASFVVNILLRLAPKVRLVEITWVRCAGYYLMINKIYIPVYVMIITHFTADKYYHMQPNYIFILE